ncbi:cyclic nucleotide-binding protein [Roseivivax marinus]|uniref:Cyclic nucleotide-binding protein n=1 Tax=Roseivivax marinus TaxID=1379903 RepID=W4HFR9_9RHOB|nr:acyl-CoA dehydrogenase family protein [Roseivivax marinus]ETW11544.1 cyclic nucleotide-binding protein [Roseivivax marinus]
MRHLTDALAKLAPAGPEEPAIGPLVEHLREAGLLSACAPADTGGSDLAHLPDDPARLAETLAAVGAASLSAGRLFEGHVNAAKLVALYARGDARDRWCAAIARGQLFGIWGAEGAQPVRLSDGRLAGEKRFASGADILDHAIITARDDAGDVQLLVVGLDRLEGRLFPEEWSVSGMKATASGRVDLDGLRIEPGDHLGAPADYLREPHFQGGVWRYAAVQLGAMQEMTRCTAHQLGARGQTEAPLQAARLRRMVMACETARLWVDHAARTVERPEARPCDAGVAMLARLTIEREAVALMQEMDAALGAASFATAHPVERHRRDLQFYLRQANPDGLGEAAMGWLRETPEDTRRWNLS